MYIYKITNTLSNEVYIGQTVNLRSRWNAHKRCTVSKVDKAIHDIGLNNFKFDVLFECNQRDASLLESYLIYKFNSIENGYNVVYSKKLDACDLHRAELILREISSGNYILTGEYVCKNNDNRRIYCIEDDIVFDNALECSSFYNITSVARVRDVCIGKRATANNLTFRFLDEDGNIVEPVKGAKKKTVEVYVEETYTFYPSIKSACDDLGLDYRRSNSAIGKHMNGLTENAYGYHFHYVKDNEYIPSRYVCRRKKRKVIVDGVNIFNSVADAILYYNLPYNARGAIGQCCNGKSSSAYGHKWSYLDDNGNPILNEKSVK